MAEFVNIAQMDKFKIIQLLRNYFFGLKLEK